jgi:two-component system OmpR family sensor kinase
VVAAPGGGGGPRHRRPADLTAIVREVVDGARVLAAANGVELTVAGVPAAVGRLDQPSVTRAVANLIDNAIRHAPRASEVEVEVQIDDTDASVLVVDHGPGIAAEEQDRLFERFAHGDDGPSRTGLGLAIVRQIAVAHGGDVTLSSPGPAGDGCAFLLRLRR